MKWPRNTNIEHHIVNKGVADDCYYPLNSTIKYKYYRNGLLVISISYKRHSHGTPEFTKSLFFPLCRRKVLGLVKVLAQVSQIHRLVLDKGIAL
jgi:hypothetical protein